MKIAGYYSRCRALAMKDASETATIGRMDVVIPHPAARGGKRREGDRWTGNYGGSPGQCVV